MAKTITQLPDATSVADSDELIVQQSGITKRASKLEVLAGIGTASISDAAVTAAKLSGAQTGSAPIYGARAWVNFDANRDSTGASNTNNTNRFIRGSGNVSSVLRTATGTYNVTFTTQMPDANYAGMATAGSGDAAQIFTAAVQNTSSSVATIYTADSGFTSNVNLGTPADLNTVSFVVFR
jgi:hypothetical protein